MYYIAPKMGKPQKDFSIVDHHVYLYTEKEHIHAVYKYMGEIRVIPVHDQPDIVDRSFCDRKMIKNNYENL